MSNERRRRLVMWLLALSLFLSLVVKKSCEAIPGGKPAAFFYEAPIKVQIAGPLLNPGVYQFYDAPPVGAVIKLADGGDLLAKLDSDMLHRSLQSGDVVKIVKKADSMAVIIGRMEVAEFMVHGIPLSIREMEGEDWEMLPGIGPSLAREIEKTRQFRDGFHRLDDLYQVHGIGEKKINDLRPFFLKD